MVEPKLGRCRIIDSGRELQESGRETKAMIVSMPEVNSEGQTLKVEKDYRYLSAHSEQGGIWRKAASRKG